MKFETKIKMEYAKSETGLLVGITPTIFYAFIPLFVVLNFHLNVPPKGIRKKSYKL